MKKRMICLFLTILMVLALAPAVISAEETTVDVVIRGSEWDRLEVAAMNLLNNFREEDGFSALRQNETLTDSARQRAAEVNLYYTPDHTRPDGSPAESILEGRHDNYTVFQELIAIGPATGAEAIEYWMNDEASRAILFSKEFTNIGVGTFESSGTICWVALLTDCDTGWGSGELAEEYAMRFVSILPDRIQQDLTGEMEITIPVGEEPSFYFTVSNPTWEGLQAVIDPWPTRVSGSDWLYFGCYQNQDGRTTIISNDVVASYVFRVGCYDGDPGDLELTIHVVDEEVPEMIPGHEHTPATLRQREAVCNIDGYTGTTYCTECHS